MVAIGVGMFWAGYTGVLWGVFLITGKNVGLKQLLSFTTWPPVSAGAKPAVPVKPGGTKPGGVNITPTPTGQLTQAQQLLGR